MKVDYLNPANKVAAKTRGPEIRNITCLFDNCINKDRKKPDVRRRKPEVENRIDKKKTLTVREFEITKKLSGGMQNKEIADAFGICLNTVKSHLQNVYNKIDVENRIEATLWYLDFIGKLKRTTGEK